MKVEQIRFTRETGRNRYTIAERVEIEAIEISSDDSDFVEIELTEDGPGLKKGALLRVLKQKLKARKEPKTKPAKKKQRGS